MTSELKVAIKAAKQAGKLLLDDFGKFSKFKFKGKWEIKTPADYKSEKTILGIIQKNFPSHSVYSEEKGLLNQESQFLWIIDPLDGTTNFSRQIPIFNISIALAIQEELSLGVVFNPFTKELYYAQKGKGAFLNNEKIKVSRVNNLSKTVVSLWKGTSENDIDPIKKIFGKIIERVHTTRIFSSCALELCYVASGKLDAFINHGSKPYDYAAGVLIVQEAGGTVTDFNNNPFNLKTKNILASNGKIHNEILKLIKS